MPNNDNVAFVPEFRMFVIEAQNLVTARKSMKIL